MRHPWFTAVLVAALCWGAVGRADERDTDGPLGEFMDAFADFVAMQVAATADRTGVETLDKRVRRAIAHTPRHAFVPPQLRPYAYADTPLPLGHGQNISQPFIVALMTHLARIEPTDVVFETGTGAGWQAAILSKLAARVVSVEFIQPLAERATRRLTRMGYDNVQVHIGDGYYGRAADGPYDAIIIKEAVRTLPPPLLKQLKPGGRLIAPIGPEQGPQHLTVVEKAQDGSISERRVLEVLFGFLPGGERI